MNREVETRGGRASTWAEDRVRHQVGWGSASHYLPGPKGGGWAYWNCASLSLPISPSLSPGLQALSFLSLLQEGSLEGRATEPGLLTIKRGR